MTEQINFGGDVTDTKSAPEGHDAKMAEAFDKQAAPPSETPPAEERPQWLDPKFKSPEDLAKAYDELSKKLGTAPKEEVKADPNKDPLKIEPADEAAKSAVQAAGLDFDALSAKFAEKGTIDAEDFEALEKAGIPRAYVDNYMAGVQAQVDAVRYQVLSEVGGEENFAAMSAWAAQNLDPAALDAYNRAVDAPDVNSKKLAVKGLYAQYTAANGSEPSLIGGQAPSEGPAFRSVAEMTAAMADPRYQNDPAYRDDVRNRLARSNIL